MTASHSDALVLFGVTGDLAHKLIFPALYAMAKRGNLKVPVIGVAFPQWTLAQLCNRVKDSIKRSGGIDDRRALDRLLSLLSYVHGDYNDRNTFAAIKEALGRARRPAYYLAIPPCALRDGDRRTRRRRPGRPCPRDRRKAVRARPGLGPRSEPRRGVGVPGRLDFPHRPLPRQGGDHEYPLFPLRQFVPRADLEPQLRRQRPDHAGRGFRRGRPRRILRNGRLSARRNPEPPLPGRRAAGHGAAGLSGLRAPCTARKPRSSRRCAP